MFFKNMLRHISGVLLAILFLTASAFVRTSDVFRIGSAGRFDVVELQEERLPMLNLMEVWIVISYLLLFFQFERG